VEEHSSATAERENSLSGAKGSPPSCISAVRHRRWQQGPEVRRPFPLLAPVPEEYAGQRESNRCGGTGRRRRGGAAGAGPTGAGLGLFQPPQAGVTEKGKEGNRWEEARRPQARRRSPAGSLPAPSGALRRHARRNRESVALGFSRDSVLSPF
jgi:hypothetical protein